MSSIGPEFESASAPRLVMRRHPLSENGSINEYEPPLLVISDAKSEYYKGRQLWLDLGAVIEKPGETSMRELAQHWCQRTGLLSMASDENMNDTECLRNATDVYGSFTYRMLCRLKDYNLAYTTKHPSFAQGINISYSHSFLKTLVEVALRRIQIQLFKKQLNSARNEWEREIRRLYICDEHLRRFQEQGNFKVVSKSDSAVMKRWRLEAIRKQFRCRVLESERHDRLDERIAKENDLLRVLEKAVDETVNTLKAPCPDNKPSERSMKSWDACKGAVEKFYTVWGDEPVLTEDETTRLAQIFCRFASMMRSNVDQLPFDKLLPTYIDDILNTSRI